MVTFGKFLIVSRSHLHQTESVNSPNNDADFEIVKHSQSIQCQGLLGKVGAFSMGPPSSGTTFHRVLFVSAHKLVSFPSLLCVTSLASVWSPSSI